MTDLGLIVAVVGLALMAFTQAAEVGRMKDRQERLEALLVQAKVVADRLEARLRTETEAGPCDFDG